MAKKDRAVVIGTGVGGLGAAVRLALKGYRVDAFEAAPTYGGKLAECWLGDYRFDMGPSVFAMPHRVEELFELAGVPMAGHFQYRKLEKTFRYFWGDGTRVQGWSDPQRLAEELERVLQVPPQRTLDHVRRAHRLLDTTGRTFMEHSLHHVKTLWKGGVGRALFNARVPELMDTLHEVDKRQFKDPKAVQFFDRFATYNGSNPYTTPGIMRMIAGLEHERGPFYPIGGMRTIVSSLHALAEKVGVRFHFNAPVERILLDPTKRRVTGVRVNGADHGADVVVCNMDIEPAYRRLLPDLRAPERTLKQERSTSAIVFYWGIKRSFPELGLHNIFFSNDYRTEFAQLFDKLDVTDDPTVYVNITSKEDTPDAPPGCENWFAMINAPYLAGQDVDAMVRRTRAAILGKLQRILGVDIEPLIVVEDVLDPARIQERTQSHLGSIYGTSSNSKWAAFRRHPNQHPKVRGLRFCGVTVHPGGGIPLALLSAKLATETLPDAR
ncbi:MAG: phytoene desaturase [Flavobacteriales bacterium]|nr:phytoene desaturase [Flavobacteriales bacterium]